MNEKLLRLYEECINELLLIGLEEIGEIYPKTDIKISKRNAKRYGCCKHEDPDSSTKYIEKKR